MRKLNYFTLFILLLGFMPLSAKSNVESVAVPSASTETISETLVATIPSSYATAVAYDPNKDVYYLSSITAGIAAFLEDGTVLSSDNTSASLSYPAYKRGIWYNPSNNRLETNGYSNTYYFTLGANEITTGFTNMFSNSQFASPSSNSDLDTQSNLLIHLSGYNVYRYNSSNGTAVDNITLNVPVGSTLAPNSIAYTDIDNAEYAVYDVNNHRALLFNKTNGTLTRIVNFVTSNGPIVDPDNWGFSYANGYFFISSRVESVDDQLHFYKYLTDIEGDDKNVIGEADTLIYSPKEGETFLKWYKKQNNGAWQVYNTTDTMIVEQYDTVSQWHYMVEVSSEGELDSTSVFTVQSKYEQTLSFDALLEMAMTDADQTPVASTNSDSIITFSSSNTGIATIVNGEVHPVGVGSTTITAIAAENDWYWASVSIDHDVIIKSQSQTITFNPLSDAMVGAADLAPGATASSSLAISYSSSDSSIATIVDNKIRFVSAGTCTIYADQTGNETYAAAPQASQALTVLVYTPSITDIAPSNGSVLLEDSTYTASATITTQDPGGIDSAIIVFGISTDALLDTMSLTADVDTFSTNFSINYAGVYYAKIVAYGNNATITSSDTLVITCRSLTPLIIKTYPSQDTIYTVGDSMLLAVMATVDSGFIDSAYAIASPDGVNLFPIAIPLDSIATNLYGLSGYASEPQRIYIAFVVEANGDTAMSQFFLFDTQCGNIDSTTALAATDINTNDFKAHWKPSPNADSYKLSVWKGTGQDSVNVRDNVTVNDTFYIVDNLEENTTYYYHVVVQIGSCQSNVSNTISLNTAMATSLKTTNTVPTVSTQAGLINISTSAPTMVNIYQLSGKQVAQDRINSNSSYDVQSGIYIVKTNEIVHKVIVP